MSKYDVTENRNIYIGGSDIPAVMGISPFRSRFDLLKEKAGFLDNDFAGNKYTEYGVTMEPKIRDHINSQMAEPFKEDRVVEGRYRYHSDGFDGSTVLEIKTTSQVHESLDGYKIYKVQLLFGMIMHEVDDGMLAVYSRPEDFNETFDADRLQVFHMKRGEEDALEKEIVVAIEQFLIDLEHLKKNPFCTEAELPSRHGLVPLAEKAAKLEATLKGLEEQRKDIEKASKEAREELRKAMEGHGIKKWELPNGTKITLVDGTPDKEVETFNAAAFEEEHPRLWKKYQVKTIKKGRKGYLKITIAK